ncbi:alpha/beta fold hydrolase [Bdellovibrio bacteriovorus]|uniref:alpha/beta fold hydrolase n=1 Tax=Bdellovibrio bacteriovorus TaxID=959 RepID=UPI0035A6CC79
MATLRINNHEYYYEEKGPKNAPAVVLSPLLYTDTSVYEPIVRILSEEYRVICYDHAGLGKSATPSSPSLTEAAEDVAQMIEELQLDPCHFVGNCLGAHVGLHLAVAHSELLQSCILMGAVAESDSEETVQDMDEFIKSAKETGLDTQVFSEMWFGPTFRATRDPVQVTRREKWLRHIAKAKPNELDAATQIFHRNDVSEDLAKIHCPVLILAGDEDSTTNLEAYSRLARNIDGSEYRTIHHAGYALVIEQPEEVAEHIRSFVSKIERHLAARAREAAAQSSFRHLW